MADPNELGRYPIAPHFRAEGQTDLRRPAFDIFPALVRVCPRLPPSADAVGDNCFPSRKNSISQEIWAMRSKAPVECITFGRRNFARRMTYPAVSRRDVLLKPTS